MKVVKISSLGCPSCIIMNNVINRIKNTYDFDIEDFDYDFDDVEIFNPGKILPVLIFYKDGTEIARLCGEHKKEEIINILEGEV